MKLTNILLKYNIANIKEEIIKTNNLIAPLTESNGIEYATGINLKTGLTDLKLLSGEKDEINIKEHLLQMYIKGDPYLHIHTHPDNSFPSPLDLRTFLHSEQIKFMMIIGLNVVFFMSKKECSDKDEVEIKSILGNYFSEINKQQKYTENYNRTKDIRYIELLFEETWEKACSELGIKFYILDGGI
jgi:hypothetical protein